METKLRETIEEEIRKLPREVGDAIGSLDWISISQKIGEDHLLTANEINNLQLETGLVLTGLENPDDYTLNIERNVLLSKTESEEISRDIFEKIFNPIFEKGKNTTEEYIELDPIFSSLPKALQEAIAHSDYKTKTYQIADKFDLPIDQMGKLEKLVVDIMLGNVHPDKLENELRSRIKIPEDKVDDIITDINEEIFKDIRYTLKSEWNKGKDKEKQKFVAKEVPLPPYAERKDDIERKAIPPLPPYAQEESKKLEEINKNTSQDNDLWKDSGIDIIGEKLNSPTKSNDKISDHSLSNKTNKRISDDPYRE